MTVQNPLERSRVRVRVKSLGNFIFVGVLDELLIIYR